MYLFNKPSGTTQLFLYLLVSAYMQANIRTVHYLEHTKKPIQSSIPGERDLFPLT